jgi:GntR family phosphonate transport system transcriptional regulator
LISAEVVPAPSFVAKPLGIEAGEDAVMVALIFEADGVAISYGQNYLPRALFPEAKRVFKAAGKGGKKLISTTEVLATMGVEDFRRKSVRIRSRRPTANEAEHLSISIGEYALETDVLNVDQSDRLIMFARTVYASSRIEFVFDY